MIWSCCCCAMSCWPCTSADCAACITPKLGSTPKLDSWSRPMPWGRGPLATSGAGDCSGAGASTGRWPAAPCGRGKVGPKKPGRAAAAGACGAAAAGVLPGNAARLLVMAWSWASCWSCCTREGWMPADMSAWVCAAEGGPMEAIVCSWRMISSCTAREDTLAAAGMAAGGEADADRGAPVGGVVIWGEWDEVVVSATWSTERFTPACAAAGWCADVVVAPSTRPRAASTACVSASWCTSCCACL
mmetsp:Transcript_15903/g.42803  ORF Transcript_15903/g.42803 Transcript_15903/m.42803 type:complete len:245 (+) Transcript_15903:533-1267(+)